MRTVLLVLLPAPLFAQTIDQIRDELRRSASADRYSVLAAALGSVTRDGEMSGGSFDIDTEPRAELSRIALPLQANWLGPRDGDSLRAEAAVGYSDLHLSIPDLWSGSLSGQETRVETDYRAFTADAGLGPSLALGSGYTVCALAHVGVSYLRNDADYSGPGAALTSSIVDGILFEWDGWYGVYGGSLALRQWHWRLGETELLPLLRYDLRETVDLAVEDAAQEVDASTQWMTVRCDTRTPLGIDIAGEELHGLLGLGYRRFLGTSEKALGFADFYELTVGVDCSAKPVLPLLGTVRVTASLLFGEDVDGWTVGGTASF